jgi:hypothetical protein
MGRYFVAFNSKNSCHVVQSLFKKWEMIALTLVWKRLSTTPPALRSCKKQILEVGDVRIPGPGQTKPMARPIQLNSNSIQMFIVGL